MVDPVARGPVADQARDGSYVDWGCAFAGAITAAAISFVLITFASGIGLSLVSPWTGEGASAVTFAILTALCVVVAQVGAFAAGGYLAGRMRRPWKDASAEESEFRDGVHGALVWAVGVAFGAFVLAATAAGTAKTAAEIGAAAAARSPGTASDATTSAVDALFRSTNAAQPARDTDYRAEAGRLIASGVGRTEMRAADRTYLAQLVAARTGVPQAEAEQRVNQAITNAKVTADRARKTGIVAAFLAAASLLAGCAAAWTAARLGGMHRNQGTIWRGFARRETSPLARKTAM